MATDRAVACDLPAPDGPARLQGTARWDCERSGGGIAASAPHTRACRACGKTFTTRCFPRPFRRTDGTETVRWIPAERLCQRCQPSLFEVPA